MRGRCVKYETSEWGVVCGWRMVCGVAWRGGVGWERGVESGGVSGECGGGGMWGWGWGWRVCGWGYVGVYGGIWGYVGHLSSF